MLIDLERHLCSKVALKYFLPLATCSMISEKIAILLWRSLGRYVYLRGPIHKVLNLTVVCNLEPRSLASGGTWTQHIESHYPGIVPGMKLLSTCLPGPSTGIIYWRYDQQEPQCCDRSAI